MSAAAGAPMIGVNRGGEMAGVLDRAGLRVSMERLARLIARLNRLGFKLGCGFRDTHTLCSFDRGCFVLGLESTFLELDRLFHGCESDSSAIADPEPDRTHLWSTASVQTRVCDVASSLSFP